MTDRQIANGILRMVANDCGPARRNTLVGIAEHHGATDAKALVDGLIKSGKLVKVCGSRRGARYGRPEKKREH